MNTKRFGLRLAAGTWLASLSLAPATTLAADYWLKAQATSITMPDGAAVPMWAFASCTDATFATCGAPTVPGPALAVPPGEGLTVTLRNELPAPVSLVIHGQVASMTPVWNDGTSGPRPSPAARVRSFTHEAAPAGGTATYSWPAMRHGTYLYQSGTHPQVQVQMGLYGAATKDYAAGMAYPGVAYDAQVTLLYSEIDPALHDAVAGPTPTYGTAAGPTSTLNYVPRYFLVNGKAFQAGDPPLANIGVASTTLLRFLNAGLATRVPTLDSEHLRLIAEDGNPYPWPDHPRQRYAVLLPAGKTLDATLAPAPGGAARIAIYDRAMGLTNNMAGPGGMLSFLSVGDVGTAPTITSTPVTAATAGQPYAYAVTASDPEGGPFAFTLDTAPSGMAIGATTGAVSWTPTVGQVGDHAVTLRVTDPTARFATQSFTVSVAADAAAQPPSITSTPVTSATYGQAYAYQVAASDPEGGAIAYSLDAAPAGMAIDAAGLVTWTPQKSQVGSASVTVRATDPTTLFATQSFAIAVADANYAPAAAPDAYAMIQGGTLAVPAPGVLGNDADPDGDAMAATLVASPADGTLALAANGSFTYTPPANVPLAGASATRVFTYTASDPLAQASNVATVTITIAANKPPVAVDDTFAAPRRTGNAAYTPVVLAVLGNDYDPDSAQDATNAINAASVAIPATSQPNKGGVATVNPDGSIAYTPARNFRGTETFQYTVTDTRGAVSALATVRVNVQ